MENASISTEPKSFFALLQEANQANIQARKPTILGTAQDLTANTISIFSGTVQSLAQGMELANSYMAEELDRMDASRTATKVEATISQLTSIAQLTALGCSAEEAVQLATSYRR